MGSGDWLHGSLALTSCAERPRLCPTFYVVWVISVGATREKLLRLTIAILSAVALLLTSATACGNNQFVDLYGAPPAPASGVDVWIASDGGAIWHSSDGGAAWKQQSSGTTRRLIDVTFSDAEHGWAVGIGGIILPTTDGGATWRTQSSSGPTLWHVACVDAQHVWALGPDGALLTSADGGGTWQSQKVRGVDLGASDGGGVAFADVNHGWIAAGNAVRATSDGGRTWVVQCRRQDIELRGIACSDARHAWAVGTRGQEGEPLVLATSDDGATWNVQHVGKPGVDLTDFALSTVACADDLHVWAAAGSGQGYVAATTDGGRSWQVHRFSTSLSANAVAAADADHVFLTTTGQPVMVSSDGGITWSASGRISWLPEGPAQGVAAVSSTAP